MRMVGGRSPDGCDTRRRSTARAATDRLTETRARAAARARRPLHAARRPAATCCATPTSCRPAATSTASTRSASPAPSPCRTARARPSGCSRATWPTATRFPKRIAMVLWGTDNLKSEGGPIAQALALIGARPRFDSYGRLAGAELIPLAELGRPRIDVVDHAVGHLPRPAAAADPAAGRSRAASPPAPTSRSSMNFVRKHALALPGASTAATWRPRRCASSATPRAPTAPTSTSLIDSGALERRRRARRDLRAAARASPTAAPAGRCSSAALLQSVLAGVDLAYQNLDSVELGVTTSTITSTRSAASAARSQRAAGQAAPVYIGDADAGRRQGAHAGRAGRARNPHPHAQPEVVRGHAQARLRRRAPDRGARHQHDGLVGDHRPGRSPGSTSSSARPSCSTPRCASGSPRSIPRPRRASPTACSKPASAHFWTPDAATLEALRARQRRTRRPPRRRRSRRQHEER